MAQYELNLAPKDLSSQSAAFRKQYPTEADLPGEFIIQPKFDGCLAIVVADPVNPRVLTRTGELIISMGHVLNTAVAAFPGMVLFGEAYQYTLEIVSNEEVHDENMVVGSCESGTKKIIYQNNDRQPSR